MFQAHRLFWKLFGAFSLATAASFIIGLAFVQLTSSDASLIVPAQGKPIQVASTIQQRGVREAVELLDSNSPDERLAISDANDRWIAGARGIPNSIPPLSITAPDGSEFHVRVRTDEPISPNRTVPVIVGVLVSLVFSAVVAWYLSRPLAYLSRGFRDVARGELTTRLHPLVGSRRDEIADLTSEFDRMAAQLERLLDTQARLLHDISHELRSPLARLEVAIGLLRQSPEKLPAMLDRVQRESERLDQLIGELLTLARLKSADSEFMVARIDLVDLLSAIIDDARFEAAAKGCEVHYEAKGSFETMAEGETLHRAFENVIRNAIKYAPPETVIEVTTSFGQNEFLVTVRDHGPGVPPDMSEAIFQPFHRGHQYQGGDVPGFGLGLAIAKYAVERHEGTIRAVTGPGRSGLAIEIRLPRLSQQAMIAAGSAQPSG